MKYLHLRVFETRSGLRCHMVSTAQWVRGVPQKRVRSLHLEDGPLCFIQSEKGISPEVTYQMAEQWYAAWVADGRPSHVELADRVRDYSKLTGSIPVARA